MPTLAESLQRIPDLDQSKMPGMDPNTAAKLFDDLLAGGEALLIELIDALKDVDDGSDYRARFALHNLAKVVAAPQRQEDRQRFLKAVTSQLGGDRPAGVQTFLVQQLQWIGGKGELDKLAGLLVHEDPRLFDAVLAAMVVNGKAAEPFLKSVVENADPDRAASIRNAIGQV